MRGVER